MTKKNLEEIFREKLRNFSLKGKYHDGKWKDMEHLLDNAETGGSNKNQASSRPGWIYLYMGITLLATLLIMSVIWVFELTDQKLQVYDNKNEVTRLHKRDTGDELKLSDGRSTNGITANDPGRSYQSIANKRPPGHFEEFRRMPLSGKSQEKVNTTSHGQKGKENASVAYEKIYNSPDPLSNYGLMATLPQIELSVELQMDEYPSAPRIDSIVQYIRAYRLSQSEWRLSGILGISFNQAFYSDDNGFNTGRSLLAGILFEKNLTRRVFASAGILYYKSSGHRLVYEQTETRVFLQRNTRIYRTELNQIRSLVLTKGLGYELTPQIQLSGGPYICWNFQNLSTRMVSTASTSDGVEIQRRKLAGYHELNRDFEWGGHLGVEVRLSSRIHSGIRVTHGFSDQMNSNWFPGYKSKNLLIYLKGRLR